METTVQWHRPSCQCWCRVTTNTCSHCGTANTIIKAYDEPYCLLCGWVDYETAPEADEDRRRATQGRLLAPRGYSVAYTGDIPKLRKVAVTVVLRPGVAYPSPVCPWDAERMIPAGHTYSRHGQRVKGSWFGCVSYGHRILLSRNHLGDATGWS